MRYRTTVTNSGSTSYYDYVWDSNKLISMVYTSGNTSQTAKYLYGSSDEVIGMVITDSNNSINNYYYLRNAQGDITGIVNSTGKKIISYTYDVFGNCTETYHSTNTTENANYLKVNALNPFAYRGYCFDADMGQYYLQSRYYDPSTGRFINADDTNYLNVTGTVLSCNLFAYCENDPVNKVDPSGCYFVQNTYWYLEDKSYFINTDIYVGNKSRNIVYSYKNYVFSIMNYAAAMRTIVNRKWLKPLAHGMYDFAKYVDGKPLKGRSIKGIQFELLVHYIVYVALCERKNLTEKEQEHFESARVADIGDTDHDHNAKTFEKYKHLYSFLEIRFFTKTQNAYAVYKIADKLGVLP